MYLYRCDLCPLHMYLILSGFWRIIVCAAKGGAAVAAMGFRMRLSEGWGQDAIFAANDGRRTFSSKSHLGLYLLIFVVRLYFQFCLG